MAISEAAETDVGRGAEGTETCQVCGVNYGLLWHAPQPLWDHVRHRQGGLMCPRCFDRAARALGYGVTWMPVVHHSPDEEHGNSNHWHNETRDWLLMGQPDPDYPERCEHPVWVVVRDALEAAGYPQPPMDYYPPGNFKLPSRSNPDAGYHKMHRLAIEKHGTPEELARYDAWAAENLVASQEPKGRSE